MKQHKNENETARRMSEAWKSFFSAMRGIKIEDFTFCVTLSLSVLREKLWFFMLSASDSDFGVSIKMRDSQIMLAITVTMRMLKEAGGRKGADQRLIQLHSYEPKSIALRERESQYAEEFYWIQTFIAWFVLSVSEKPQQVLDARLSANRQHNTHSSDVLVCIKPPYDDSRKSENLKSEKSRQKWNEILSNTRRKY